MVQAVADHGAEGGVVEPALGLVRGIVGCGRSAWWMAWWGGGGVGEGGGLWRNTRIIICVIVWWSIGSVGRVVGLWVSGCGASPLPGWERSPVSRSVR